jgi:hypothetical protein
VSVTDEGRIYVAWMDSRSGRNHRLQLNQSADGGRDWLPEPRRMDSSDAGIYEPFVTASGDRVALGWIEAQGGERSLLLRYSNDGGSTWSEERALPTQGDVPMTPQGLYSSAGLSVFYFSDGKGIRLLQSRDNGSAWNDPVTVAGTEASGSSGFLVRSNRSGGVCLAWPGPFRLSGRKADIYATCSQDAELTWQAAERLNTNSPGISHSLAPAVVMDEEGRVLVAWQDLRTVRANIFLNYSLDGGRHWQARDLRVNRDPGREHAQFPDLATDGRGRFLISWQQTVSDDPRSAEYRLAFEDLRFACPGSAGAAKDLCREPRGQESTDARREARLRERVRAFWQGYVDGDFVAGFGMMDPFFRARTSAAQFASRVGQIDYSAFEILDEGIEVIDNRARVPVRITFEAKQLQIGAEIGTIPQTQMTIDDEWVWVDRDWYKVYTSQAGDFLPKL